MKNRWICILEKLFSRMPTKPKKRFMTSPHPAVGMGHAGNVLLKSKFVQKANNDEPTDLNLALSLADKLSKAVASFENSPKDESLHRVLYRTFINPVGSQEQTADFLYMSFSTYRRQVKRGVERIADILWLEEKKAQ